MSISRGGGIRACRPTRRSRKKHTASSAKSSFSCKPSTVDEAILEMNMLGHTFFLFRDADTDEIHAVYRRKDGSYGVLIPER